MSAEYERRANIAAPEFRRFPNFPEGFRPGIARYGSLFGAGSTGMSLYELPPGEAIGPYHYEYPEEEWLLVIEGRPTLRNPGGETELEAWDVVFFPSGPEGAHKVRNDTDSTVRVLMFSNTSRVAASVYPDSEKVAIWTGNDDDDLIVKRTSSVGYWEGESADTSS
ncbi:MAG: cupin domain-containing protein [Gaiellaceae bacterium]